MNRTITHPSRFLLVPTAGERSAAAGRDLSRGHRRLRRHPGIDGPQLGPGPGPDGTDTVEQALSLSGADGTVPVEGHVLAIDVGTYPCALTESSPPGCGAGALLLEGVDVGLLDVPLSGGVQLDR